MDNDSIKKYLKIIDKYAKYYENKHHDYDELFSEGQFKLIEFLDTNPVNTDHNIRRAIYTTIKNLASTVDDYIDYSVDMNILAKRIKIVPHDTIHKLFYGLSDREKDILTKRFGTYGPILSIKEIAKIYNLSDGRIRQILNKTMEKIRINTVKYHFSYNDIFEESL